MTYMRIVGDSDGGTVKLFRIARSKRERNVMVFTVTCFKKHLGRPLSSKGCCTIFLIQCENNLHLTLLLYVDFIFVMTFKDSWCKCVQNTMQCHKRWQIRHCQSYIIVSYPMKHKVHNSRVLFVLAISVFLFASLSQYDWWVVSARSFKMPSFPTEHSSQHKNSSIHKSFTTPCRIYMWIDLWEN